MIKRIPSNGKGTWGVIRVIRVIGERNMGSDSVDMRRDYGESYRIQRMDDCRCKIGE